MKKLNSYLITIIILTSAFLISSKNIYSQWTIAGDLAGVAGSRPQVSVVDGNTAYVTGGSTLNATYKTTNGGTNWILLNTGTTKPFWAIGAIDANNVFAGTDPSGGTVNFYKSINGGNNWTIIDSFTVTGSGIPGFKGIRFSISIPSFGIAYAEGNDGDVYIYKTRDGGNTWMRTVLPGYPGFNISGGLNVIDSLFYAFGTATGPPSMIITTNGGATWNLRDLNLPLASINITRGLAFKEDKLTGIAGSSSFPIISRTTNGGLNWENFDVGNNVINASGSIMRWIEGTNICYLTASGSSIGGVINGVLKSTNGGLNWAPMTTSELGINYMDTKTIGSNIYGYANSAVPGAFGGNVVLKVTDVVVGINQISELVPYEYKLSQNYPNPFNPVTNLEFGISKLGLVSLKIYDMLGKEVVTLVNENLHPGTYKYNFDASGLSSGIYYYKLMTDNFYDTKKMTLIK